MPFTENDVSPSMAFAARMWYLLKVSSHLMATWMSPTLAPPMETESHWKSSRSLRAVFGDVTLALPDTFPDKSELSPKRMPAEERSYLCRLKSRVSAALSDSFPHAETVCSPLWRLKLLTDKVLPCTNMSDGARVQSFLSMRNVDSPVCTSTARTPSFLMREAYSATSPLSPSVLSSSLLS